MQPEKTRNEWTKDAYFSKAQRYADVMIEKDRGEWEFWFWSVLTLEMLLRASVSNISPVLVANGQSFDNLLYALNKESISPKFTPSSINIKEVLNRARRLIPAFTDELESISTILITMRNSELHSGGLAFDNISTSHWLPRIYAVYEPLLESMGENLVSLLGKDVGEEAKNQISVMDDASSKEVMGDIKAHNVVWERKDADEKAKLVDQAKKNAKRHVGHRVSCPACHSPSLLTGSAIGSPKVDIDSNEVIERTEVLPSLFECTACGLRVQGYSKLAACGLGNTFQRTSHYSPAEYFGIRDDSDYYMEDNNEPF